MYSQQVQKKRLIKFSDIYDYNFLLYNILIILYNYKCFFPDKFFNDCRKLPILIELINSNRIKNIIISNLMNNKVYSTEEQDYLYALIGRAKTIRKQIYQLIFSLSKKGLFKLKIKSEIIDIAIIDHLLVNKFLSNEIFNEEKEKIKQIDKVIQRIRIISYSTFIEKIFDSKGVLSWQL